MRAWLHAIGFGVLIWIRPDTRPAANRERKELAPRPSTALPLLFGLEAAERSYCQTALDLGYGEAQAESWAAALMFRLRAEVEKQISAK